METETRIAAVGFAAHETGGDLSRWSFNRRAPRPKDVVIAIRYCGICHSDIHNIHNSWGYSRYPLVPGHEIVGEVIRVGTGVDNLAVGQNVAVGTIVDSCRHCGPCSNKLEQYCEEYPTLTYNGIDRTSGETTFGGFSNILVVDERFVHPVPASLELANVAPLLCAGITTYSPLRHWNIGPGYTVGVVGLGGLGHMAIKFTHALGAYVVLFTTSASKCADGLALGADEAILSTDAETMQTQANRFDFILDTVPVAHPLNPYLIALKLDGTLCSLGIPAAGLDFDPGLLAAGRKQISSSGVGGTKETSEMLAFCALHGIVSDIELVGFDQIPDAFERLERGDVRYRFVIDIAMGPAALQPAPA
jgi:alcohol dehydrogenase (NADP+)